MTDESIEPVSLESAQLGWIGKFWGAIQGIGKHVLCRAPEPDYAY